MTTTDATGRRVSPWLGDAVAAVVVVVAAIFPDVSGRPGLPPGAPPGMALLSALPIVLVIALIPLRRRWPVPVFAIAVILYAATTIRGDGSISIGIVAVLAAYTLGSRSTRLTTLISGGLGTLLVAILSVTVADFGVVNPRIFQIAAAIAVAGALGDSARSRREFLQAATERAERAEQTREAEAQRRVAEERLRIAQDLHDTVAHQISVINLNAGMASSALEKSPENAREALGRIRTSARGALSEIGSLLRYLRSDQPSGTDTAPQPRLADIDRLVAQVREAGMDVRVTRTGDSDGASTSTETVAYRVIQEGLTNAHKHGAEDRATVDIDTSDQQLTVTITNPVAGGAPNQSDPPSGGFGLTGIRERVAAVGGTVDIARTPTSFTLVARLPLAGKDNA